MRSRSSLQALAWAVLVAACGGGSKTGGDPISGTSTCVEGASCALADPCRRGRTSCAGGASACVDSGNVPDGTACGGGNVVCKAGACVVSCVGNQDCQPENPCTTGISTCTSAAAAPGCVVTENRPDATSCGAGLVCSGGSCVSASSCSAGAACEPSDPCKTGSIACSSATAPGTCQVSGSQPDGTACGNGLVCAGGACTAACITGRSCELANACAVAVTACSSPWAAPTCTESGAKPDGTACGNGQACAGGRCTTPDRTPPTVVRQVPAPDATDVWSRDPITVTFSEPMDPASLNGHSVRLANSHGEAIETTLHPSSDGRMMTVAPLALKVPARLTLALEGARDVAGNTLTPAAWSWDVPAWQSLGRPPVDELLDANLHPSVTVDASGAPVIAVANQGNQTSLDLFRWDNGWGESMLSLRGGEVVMDASTVEVDARSNPAVAYLYRVFHDDPLNSLHVVRWVNGTRMPTEIVHSGDVQPPVIRFDHQNRLVVAYAVRMPGPNGQEEIRLLVRRLESSGWRDLTSGGIVLGGYAAGLDLSIDESGEPQVAWAEVEASSSWKLVIRGAFLEGTSWRFFAGLGWEDGTDPVAWKVSRFGELFVGRVEASRQRCYVTMYRRDGTGQDLGSIPGTFGGALLLGSDGRPRIIWRENSAYCGRRWTGESWAWMATDTACASDGGPPGAASVGLADIPTVCDYDHVRGGGPNILCHRYNEYVRATLSVPLEKIVINEAKGGTTSGGGPHQFRVAYRPADATDRTLTWKVCTGPAVACSPDPTGHCRTCTTATNLGTITNSGLYTPPSSLALPAKVWVLACQKAICDWSFVDVAP